MTTETETGPPPRGCDDDGDNQRCGAHVHAAHTLSSTTTTKTTTASRRRLLLFIPTTAISSAAAISASSSSFHPLLSSALPDDASLLMLDWNRCCLYPPGSPHLNHDASSSDDDDTSLDLHESDTSSTLIAPPPSPSSSSKSPHLDLAQTPLKSPCLPTTYLKNHAFLKPFERFESPNPSPTILPVVGSSCIKEEDVDPWLLDEGDNRCSSPKSIDDDYGDVVFDQCSEQIITDSSTRNYLLPFCWDVEDTHPPPHRRHSFMNSDNGGGGFEPTVRVRGRDVDVITGRFIVNPQQPHIMESETSNSKDSKTHERKRSTVRSATSLLAKLGSLSLTKRRSASVNIDASRHTCERNLLLSTHLTRSSSSSVTKDHAPSSSVIQHGGADRDNSIDSIPSVTEVQWVPLPRPTRATPEEEESEDSSGVSVRRVDSGHARSLRKTSVRRLPSHSATLHEYFDPLKGVMSGPHVPDVSDAIGPCERDATCKDMDLTASRFKTDGDVGDCDFELGHRRRLNQVGWSWMDAFTKKLLWKY